MYSKSHLNFGALAANRDEAACEVDEETRRLMTMQSERLFMETKSLLAKLMPLSQHLVNKLLNAHEMGLQEALQEIRNFEAGSA